MQPCCLRWPPVGGTLYSHLSGRGGIEATGRQWGTARSASVGLHHRLAAAAWCLGTKQTASGRHTQLLPTLWQTQDMQRLESHHSVILHADTR